MDILEELQWRGLMADCTDTKALKKRLSEGPITLYCGFDPTADSLHVGHLVPLIALRRFQDMGHHPIAVAGGATGSIGDPSGKSAERQLLSHTQLQHNIEKVKVQLARLLDFESETHPARLVDNASWAGAMSYLDFLRDIGKHFTVNVMVSKESVRARMEDREIGISYTTNSATCFSGPGFLSPQQRNRLRTADWRDRPMGQHHHGYRVDPEKIRQASLWADHATDYQIRWNQFGKTESGAIWLNPVRTSVYRFYQFWIRTDDHDAIPYPKFFTFLKQKTIEELSQNRAQAPKTRSAKSPGCLTDLIHGKDATREAQRASDILFGGDLDGITEPVFNEVLGEVPTTQVASQLLQQDGWPLPDALVEAGLATSKGKLEKISRVEAPISTT